MVALPTLGSQTDQMGLAGPPSRRACAPAGQGVPRARASRRLLRNRLPAWGGVQAVGANESAPRVG